MTVAPAFVPTPAPQAQQVTPPAGPAPPMHPVEQTALNLSDLVDKYRRLRDKKKDLAEGHREQLKPYNEAMGQLEAMILDALNKSGVESIRTANGTAFKSTRSSYTVKDPAQFREWLEANNRFDLLETRVSKEAIETLVQSGASLPPGLGISSEVTINVRK